MQGNVERVVECLKIRVFGCVVVVCVGVCVCVWLCSFRVCVFCGCEGGVCGCVCCCVCVSVCVVCVCVRVFQLLLHCTANCCSHPQVVNMDVTFLIAINTCKFHST
jgi:ascorbate-specific PTS system EIIC-type component UlaA